MKKLLFTFSLLSSCASSVMEDGVKNSLYSEKNVPIHNSTKEETKYNAYLLPVITKGKSGHDFTRNVLTTLEISECLWELSEFNSSSSERRNTFNRDLLGSKFEYRVSGRNKKDYLFDNSEVVFHDKQGRITNLDNEIKFLPNKGKRTLSNKHEPIKSKLKWWLPYKHLGTRNGCYVNLGKILTNLEENNSGIFDIISVRAFEHDKSVVLELVNRENADILYLKSIDIKPNFGNLKPYQVFNKTEGLSNFKKYSYYVGTGGAAMFLTSEVLILSGLAVGSFGGSLVLGALFFGGLSSASVIAQARTKEYTTPEVPYKSLDNEE